MDLGPVITFLVGRCHIQVMLESPLLFQGLVTDVDFDIMHKLAVLRIPRVAPHFIFDLQEMMGGGDGDEEVAWPGAEVWRGGVARRVGVASCVASCMPSGAGAPVSRDPPKS